MPSIIKVDQIQSDTGSIVYPSNVSLGNTSVTNFGSTGVNARLHVEGIINLNDGQAFAFGGGTGRPSLSGNKSAGTLSFGVGGGSSKMILYGTGSDTTQGYLDLPVGQIKFPASQNASADANTLDDYEEGTFTATVFAGSTASGSSSTWSYTKIGRIVTVIGETPYAVSWPSGGIYSIRTLPFAMSGPWAVGQCWSPGLGTTFRVIVPVVFSSYSTQIRFADNSKGSGGSWVGFEFGSSDFTPSTTAVQLTYITST